MGDKPAILAKTNTQIFAESFDAVPNGGTGVLAGTPMNIKVKNTDVPLSSSVNMRLTTLNKWMYSVVKISEINKVDQVFNNITVDALDIATQQAAVSGTVFNDKMAFNVENALELLDQPGEFYYDTTSSTMYYKPRNGENLDVINCYYPISEGLLKVKGSNADNKVKNLVFNGITFANSKWDRVQRQGYVPFQGAVIHNDMAEIKDYDGDPNLVPSAVQFSMCDGVVFENCVIKNTGGVGLGIYDGVVNGNFNGNAIVDTAHGGITLGTPSYQFQDDTLTNVAYLKPVTASGNWQTHPCYSVVDDNLGTSWHSYAYSVDTWITVDLLKPYKIDKIEVVNRLDDKNAIFRKNFEIYGSNTPDFATKVLLGEVGEEGCGDLWTKAVSDSNSYRYIKYVKDGKLPFGGVKAASFADIKVYSKDTPKNKQICQNNVISNNYIARSGISYADACGIQNFYSDGSKITHNEVVDMPYTGISMGWGWEIEDSNTRVFASLNNEISGNKIALTSQRAHDGGGIYTLGRQPNLRINDNYIVGQRYLFGGIYPDQGTSGTAEFPIVTTNNYIEDAQMWFHDWSGAHGKYHNVTNNFTNVPNMVNRSTTADGVKVANTVLTTGDAYIGDVASIVSNAGILPNFVGIKNKVVTSDIKKVYTYEEELERGNTLTKGETTIKGKECKEFFAPFIKMGNYLNKNVTEGKIPTSTAIETMNTLLTQAKDKCVFANYNADFSIEELTRLKFQLRDAIILSQQGIFHTDIYNDVINTLN